MSDNLVDVNEHLGERADEQFELKVVSDLLTFYGLASHKAELIRENRQLTGRSALTLYQFHVRFPSFPMYLYSKVVTNLRKDHTVAALMQNFGNMRVYKTYCSVREDHLPADCTGQAFGLVLKWPFLNKPAVLHDMGVSTERGSMFVFRGKSETLCLEPLPSLLNGLQWNPADE